MSEFNGSKIEFNSAIYYARRVKNSAVSNEILQISYTKNDLSLEYKLQTQLDLLGLNVQYEDPRWFISDLNELYCAVTVVQFYISKSHNTAVAFFKFEENQIHQTLVIPKYKTNHIPFQKINSRENETFRLEKNWQFFFSKKQLFAFYSFYPESTLLKIDQHTGEILKVKKSVYKRQIENFGFLSGGTSPVLINGRYYSFLHSFTEEVVLNKYYRRYHISVATFNSYNPFQIQKISTTPIFTAQDESSFPDCGFVIFPGSAQYHDNSWFLCCGKNDKEVVTLNFSSEFIEVSLKDVDSPTILNKIIFNFLRFRKRIRFKLLSNYLKIIGKN